MSFINKLKSKKTRIRLYSLMDQLSFSAANFLLTILIARHFSAKDLAAYGIGLSIALIIIGILRNCYIVQNAVLLPSILRRRARSVMGQHMIVWGFLLVMELLATAFILIIYPDNLYLISIALATIACSLLYAQLDFDRMMLVKHEQYLTPFILSSVFLLLIIGLFFAIPSVDLGFLPFLGIITLYGIIKTIWIALSVKGFNLLVGSRLAIRDLKKFLASSLMAITAYSGYNHIPLFILGWLSTPLQAAGFVAMRGLMQPLNIVIRSLDIIDKNTFQAEAGNSKSGIRKVFLRQSGLYAGFSALAVVGLGVFAHPIILLAYGDDYTVFEPILIGWGVIFGLLALTFPIETVIVKLDRLNTYNFYRLFAGLVGGAAAFWLIPFYGAIGAVIACVLGWAVSYILALWILKDILFLKADE